MSLLLVGALSRREVSIHLGCVFENGHAGKGFDDFEDFLDLGLHVDESGLPAALFELLARRGKDAQAGTADELEIGEIEEEIFGPTGEQGGELALQFGRGGGIEAAADDDRSATGTLTAGYLLDLDFEWHSVYSYYVIQFARGQV